MIKLEVYYYSRPVKNKRIDKYVINGYYKYDNMQIPIKKEENQSVQNTEQKIIKGKPNLNLQMEFLLKKYNNIGLPWWCSR